MCGSLEVVAQAIAVHKRLCITWHTNPDPDSVGSGLALQRMLRERKQDAVCISPDPVQEFFGYLPGAQACEVYSSDLPLDYAAAVVLDAQTHRCGGLSTWLESGDVQVINIDHHATNPGQGGAYWVDARAAATGELIYRLGEYWGLPLNEATASNLYAAICGDTGTFRYGNTTAKTLQIAAELVASGVQPGQIAAQLYAGRSVQEMALLQAGLQTLQLSPDGRVAWVAVDERMLRGFPWADRNGEDLVQFPRMIDTVEVALLFREIESGKVKVSFRSREPLDVSRLARRLGGGGHRQAAGCTLDLPLDQAVATVTGLIASELPGRPLGVETTDEPQSGGRQGPWE